MAHPPLVVLAEGDGWIVVAKPGHLLVHRNERAPRADAALQRVRDMLGRRVYPIHRLDRAASGCLLFATHRDKAGALHAALTAEGAQKVYVAFVRGAFRKASPTQVTTPMKDDNGIEKDAQSVVRCLGASDDPRCSLLEVRPSTGRYHQVRRHVRDLDHPVIGDNEHGDSRVNRFWREEHDNRRLGLHAASLRLDDPDGGVIEAHCPLFEDHHGVWSRLPFWEEACLALPGLAQPPITAGDAAAQSERRHSPDARTP